MAKTRPTTIYLKKGNTGVFEEAFASEAGIYPGHLVELFREGGKNKVRRHSQAGGSAAKAIVVEDRLQGATINTVYADNALVSYIILAPGDEVFVRLESGASVVVNDKLASNGDGAFQPVDSGVPLLVALEDIDNSDSDSDEAFIIAQAL